MNCELCSKAAYQDTGLCPECLSEREAKAIFLQMMKEIAEATEYTSASETDYCPGCEIDDEHCL